MVYKIDNKYYIKVQGYYKEVEIIPQGNSFDISPIKGSKLEVTSVENAELVKLESENFEKPVEVEEVKEEIKREKSFNNIKKYTKR